MSKKATQPQTSPQAAGGGVDFLVRTMIEREATGKRPIRPKNVEDLLQSSMQDESDDPDFDCGDEDSDSVGTVETDEGSNDSDNAEENNADDSDESDDEDYQEKKGEAGSSSSEQDDSGSDAESSNDDSQGSDSDEPDTKKSALRETLEKLNEANDFISKRPTKKKRKVRKNQENSKPKKVGTKKGTKKKPAADSVKTKTNLAQKAVKASARKAKVTKAKKVVLAKKSKISNKKVLSEKKKKKKEKKDKKSEDKSKYRSIFSLIDDATCSQKENRKEIEVTKPVCSACLGDKSDDSNEIVECDSCGISVHEVCYGLSADNLSISSGSGSSSCTEPWFCDVCKSGSENMYCELCPTKGGLFKESTAGRWVHLVCAMYTQGVALHHDSSINLYEIHYARWGSHSCAACEDERQAHTGIVIPCDAGMCKTYFHATCAQKLGLLSDPNQVDFAEADPYYVSCKLHTNRETMKRRVRLFNTLQEQLRIKKEKKEQEGLPSGTNADHARILRKLDKVRQKTALKRAQYLNSLESVPSQLATTDQVGLNHLCNLPISWMNGNKKQRLMHTSAKLGNDFLRKTERLGEDILAHELEVKHEKIVANVKRKWNVLPAMSVEYAAYYTDRESRISGLVCQYEKSVEDNHVLMDKEIGLKDVWETHIVNQMAMSEETASVSQQLESLATILTSVCPNDKKLAARLQCFVRPKELSGARRKSPSTSRGDRKSPTPRRSSVAKKHAKNRVLSPSPSRPGKITVAVCDTCSNSDSQHLITRCDKCRKHYHLSCLDPPLTRMPKRSRLCGWMCSDCCEGPTEVERHVDPEAPRTLRGRTKIHKPRKYRGSDDSEDEKPAHEIDASRTGSKKSPKSNASSFNSLDVKDNEQVILNATPVTVRIHSSTPMERRRRSGSSNLQTVAPITVNCSPITPLPLNGPIVVPDVSSVKSEEMSPLIPKVEVNSQVEAVTAEAEQPKPLKRKYTIKNPKTPSLKQKKVKNREQSISADSTNSNSIIATPPKRKSLDGPLPSFKVNGIHGNSFPDTDGHRPVTIKPKSRVKKKKIDSTEVMHVQVTGEMLTVPESLANQSEKKVKQRKPRKKKGDDTIKLEPESTSTINTVDGIKIEDIPKLEKGKKPRKRKEKGVTAAVAAVSSTPTSKSGKKNKSRISNTPSSAGISSLREEKNGVNLVMEKVTSQILVDKLKNLQNGTVKVTKKRKSTPSAALVVPQMTLHSDEATPDEKEKSVPPKKRKRVSASMQGQPNSVDSIIEAVSSGDFLDKTMENGRDDISSESSIMHGIASVNRQLAPEQNIMQGKQMGSGVNSGEMVTVDASFLIDGTPSTQSGFSINSSIPTFYSSSNHRNSTGIRQDESSVLKLTSGRSSESNNSENVIRLQYIDTPSVTISDSTAMPPPTSSISASSNVFSGNSGVCATCTKTDGKMHLVMCDKCQLEFHFMCLVPPLKYTPRRKGHSWFCSDCDDGDSVGYTRHN